jgi:hypothetical protein
VICTIHKSKLRRLVRLGQMSGIVGRNLAIVSAVQYEQWTRPYVFDRIDRSMLSKFVGPLVY